MPPTFATVQLRDLGRQPEASSSLEWTRVTDGRAPMTGWGVLEVLVAGGAGELRIWNATTRSSVGDVSFLSSTGSAVRVRIPTDAQIDEGNLLEIQMKPSVGEPRCWAINAAMSMGTVPLVGSEVTPTFTVLTEPEDAVLLLGETYAAEFSTDIPVSYRLELRLATDPTGATIYWDAETGSSESYEFVMSTGIDGAQMRFRLSLDGAIVYTRWATVTAFDPGGDPDPETPAYYDLTTVGASIPGNGIRGFVGGTGLAADFYNSESPPPYLGPDELVGLGGWKRWIYIDQSGSSTADGLTPETATTWQGFWNRVGTTFQPGDWGRVQDGFHQDPDVVWRNRSGTALWPIRVVAENHLAAKIVSPAGGALVTFAGSNYIGFHGLDFDAQSSNVWGFCIGERWDKDTAAKFASNNIDVWHCDIHHSQQATVHVSTLGTKFIDFFATEVHHAGQNLKVSSNVNDWGPYGELMYFGTGTTSTPVTDWFVEWCHLHDTPAGEAIDCKGSSDRIKINHNLIENVRVTSQAAITRWDGRAGEIGWNLIRNVRRVQPGQASVFGWTGSSEPYTAPAGFTFSFPGYPYMYEGGAIVAGGEIDIHHNVGWDLGDSMIIHYGRDVGSGMTIRSNTCGLAPRQDAGGSAPFYRAVPTGWTGSTFRPVAFSNNLTAVASANASTAIADDFVNAQGALLASVGGGSETGWGYQLASDSAIAGTLGAMGKAGEVITPPTSSGSLDVRTSGLLTSGSSLPGSTVAGDVIVVCALALAATAGTVTIGAPAGWTEIGTEFDSTGFRSDHRWFRKTSAGGAETLTIANANRIAYWVLEGSPATFTRQAGQDGYVSGGGSIPFATVTAPADGIHLIAAGAHSDAGSTSGGTATVPSGYFASGNTTPSFHGVFAGFKPIAAGATGTVNGSIDNSANWSTTSVVVSG